MEILKILENFSNFLNQFFWFRAFKFVLGLYLIIMTVTMVLALIRMVKKYAYWDALFAVQGSKNIKPRIFQSRWDKVMELIATENQVDWKAAVLESSMMLNEVLEAVGHEGKTLGQKLTETNSEQLENLETIKKANDIKNEIVRNSEYKISKQEAEEIVEIFGDALKFFEAVS